MRAAILPAILLTCLMAKAAAASCEDDLAAARGATIAAGRPVRIIERTQTYDKTGKAAGSSTVVRDVIAPNRLRRISILENGDTGEILLVGTSG